MPVVRQQKSATQRPHKGMPFPEAPTGPLDDHESRLLNQAERDFAAKGKVKRPPNAFILFRSWAIQCHKDGRTLEFVDISVNDTLHSRGAGFAAEAWKYVSKEGQAHWTWRSKIVANAHHCLFPEYQYRPVHKHKDEKDGKDKKSGAGKRSKNAKADDELLNLELATTSECTPSTSASPMTLPHAFDFSQHQQFQFQPFEHQLQHGQLQGHPAGLLFSEDALAPSVPSYRMYIPRRASSVLPENAVFETAPRPLELERGSYELAVPNISRALRAQPQPHSQPHQPMDPFSQAVLAAADDSVTTTERPQFINPFASTSTSAFAALPSTSSHEDRYPLPMPYTAVGELGLRFSEVFASAPLPSPEHPFSLGGFDAPQPLAVQAMNEHDVLSTLETINFDAYLSSTSGSEASSPDGLSLGVDFPGVPF